MSFLNPFAVTIGAIALIAPLIVHFLTKPRPRPLPLSTIAFVYEAMRQRRSRNRLRDILVLLLRFLAIALIALAIARPDLDKNVVVSTQESDVTAARVLIVDTSLSMSAGRGGNQAIERARAVADRYLGQQNGLVADVIFADSKPDAVFGQLSSNLAALRQSVRQTDAKPQHADAMSAVNQAAEILSVTDQEMQREVVIISDFQRTDWGAVVFDALPSDTKVQLESVASENVDNLAIARFTTPDRITVGQPVTIELTVLNHTAIDRPVRCRLSLDSFSKSVERTIPPGESTLSFDFQFDQPGWVSGSAKLLGMRDDLYLDDERPLAMQISNPPSIAVVSGQNPQRRPSSAYYLFSAAQMLQPENNSSRTIHVPTDPFTRSQARQADVLLIDHPGRLNGQTIDELAAMMNQGAGMIYFVSELADGVNLDQLQTTLGATMQLPVRFVPANRRRPRKDLSVIKVNRRERPFELFADQLDLALAPVRIGGGLDTLPTEEALQDRILASLSDRSAWVTLTSCGAGKLAIVNTDLEQSNLAFSSAFLPLLGELTSTVLAASGAKEQTNCGVPFVKRLPGQYSIDDNLIAKPSQGWHEPAEGYGTWEASATGILWNWVEPNEVGVYQVQRDGDVVYKVAVAAPASESDLTFLAAGDLDSQGGSERTVGFRGLDDDDRRNDYLWSWLLVACVIGICCEVCTLRWFRT